MPIGLSLGTPTSRQFSQAACRRGLNESLRQLTAHQMPTSLRPGVQLRQPERNIDALPTQDSHPPPATTPEIPREPAVVLCETLLTSDRVTSPTAQGWPFCHRLRPAVPEAAPP